MNPNNRIGTRGQSNHVARHVGTLPYVIDRPLLEAVLHSFRVDAPSETAAEGSSSAESFIFTRSMSLQAIQQSPGQGIKQPVGEIAQHGSIPAQEDLAVGLKLSPNGLTDSSREPPSAGQLRT